MKLLVLLVITLCQICATPLLAAEYGVARGAAPVLNTAAFEAVFGGRNRQQLKTDRCGQVRELEYIALPGTAFTILGQQRSGSALVYQVETQEYSAPSGVKLYVDSRFLNLMHSPPPERRPLLPPREQIIRTLKASLGSPYVWGGNVPGGVPELAEWFYRGISKNETGHLTLAGLDCSGLLYHATDGWTPRNTSQLTSYGRGVAIAEKSASKIAKIVEPLDLIVWNGHVIIVLDRQTAIESRLECGTKNSGGVVLTPLAQRIAEVMTTRRAANAWPTGGKRSDIFVVRRWYSGSKEKNTSGEKNN